MPPLVMFFTIMLLVTGIVNCSHETLSDRRLCGDQNCAEPVSLGMTEVTYNSIIKGALSFRPHQNVAIFSKEAGCNSDLWGVQIGQKRGYAPKKFIKELKIIKKPDILLPVEEEFKHLTCNPIEEPDPHELSENVIPEDVKSIEEEENAAEKVVKPEESEGSKEEQPKNGEENVSEREEKERDKDSGTAELAESDNETENTTINHNPSSVTVETQPTVAGHIFPSISAYAAEMPDPKESTPESAEEPSKSYEVVDGTTIYEEGFVDASPVAEVVASTEAAVDVTSIDVDSSEEHQSGSTSLEEDSSTVAHTDHQEPPSIEPTATISSDVEESRDSTAELHQTTYSADEKVQENVEISPSESSDNIHATTPPDNDTGFLGLGSLTSWMFSASDDDSSNEEKASQDQKISAEEEVTSVNEGGVEPTVTATMDEAENKAEMLVEDSVSENTEEDGYNEADEDEEIDEEDDAEVEDEEDEEEEEEDEEDMFLEKTFENVEETIKIPSTNDESNLSTDNTTVTEPVEVSSSHVDGSTKDSKDSNFEEVPSPSSSVDENLVPKESEVKDIPPSNSNVEEPPSVEESTPSYDSNAKNTLTEQETELNIEAAPSTDETNKQAIGSSENMKDSSVIEDPIAKESSDTSRESLTEANSYSTAESTADTHSVPESNTEASSHSIPEANTETGSYSSPEYNPEAGSYSTPEPFAEASSYSSPESNTEANSYSSSESNMEAGSYSTQESNTEASTYASPESITKVSSHSSPEANAETGFYSSPESSTKANSYVSEDYTTESYLDVSSSFTEESITEDSNVKDDASSMPEISSEDSSVNQEASTESISASDHESDSAPSQTQESGFISSWNWFGGSSNEVKEGISENEENKTEEVDQGSYEAKETDTEQDEANTEQRDSETKQEIEEELKVIQTEEKKPEELPGLIEDAESHEVPETSTESPWFGEKRTEYAQKVEEDEAEEGGDLMSRMATLWQSIESMLPWSVELLLLESAGLSSRLLALCTFVVILCLGFSSVVLLLQKRSKEGFLMTKLQELDQKHFHLSGEFTSLENDVTRRAQKELDDLNLNWEVKFDSVQTELQAKRAEAASLTERLSTLQSEMDSAAEAMDQVNTIFDQQLNYEKYVEESRTAIELLQKQVNKQVGDVQDLRQRLQAKEDENAAMKKSYENIISKNKSNEETLEITEKRLSRTEKERDQLLERASKAEELVQDLQSNNESVSQELAEKAERLSALEEEASSLREGVPRLEGELKVLRNSIKQMKSEDEDYSIEDLLDAAPIRAELEAIQEEKVELKELVKKLQVQLTEAQESFNKTKVELKASLKVKSTLEKERNEAQEQLGSLIGKEEEMERRIGEQDSIINVRDEANAALNENVATLTMHVEDYKEQVRLLKQEIESQEVSYKQRLTSVEKQSHENWVAARQAERRLEEVKLESSQLRNKLTQTAQEKEALLKLERSHHSNGELNRTGSMELPMMPKDPMNGPFPPPPPFGAFPPPPPPDMMDMMPPHMMPPHMHPPHFPMDMRPPPLGERMSPPPFSPPPPHYAHSESSRSARSLGGDRESSPPHQYMEDYRHPKTSSPMMPYGPPRM